MNAVHGTKLQSNQTWQLKVTVELPRVYFPECHPPPALVPRAGLPDLCLREGPRKMLVKLSGSPRRATKRERSGSSLPMR